MCNGRCTKWKCMIAISGFVLTCAISYNGIFEKSTWLLVTVCAKMCNRYALKCVIATNGIWVKVPDCV